MAADRRPGLQMILRADGRWEVLYLNGSRWTNLRLGWAPDSTAAFAALAEGLFRLGDEEVIRGR